MEGSPKLTLGSRSNQDQCSAASVSDQQVIPNREQKAHKALTLKELLSLCIKGCKDLIASALKAIKIAVPASGHLSSVAHWLTRQLPQLEQWAGDANRMEDPAFNTTTPLDLNLKDNIVRFFNDIVSKLEEVRKNVDTMRTTAEEMSENASTNR